MHIRLCFLVLLILSCLSGAMAQEDAKRRAMAQEALSRGQGAVVTGNDTLGIRWLGRALYLQPDLPEALALRAALWLRNGQDQQAYQDARKVLQMDSTRNDMRVLMALALKNGGKLKEAMDAFEALWQQQPSTVVASSLVALHAQQGDTVAALKIAAYAAEKLPDQKTFSIWMAKLQAGNAKGAQWQLSQSDSEVLPAEVTVNLMGLAAMPPTETKVPQPWQQYLQGREYFREKSWQQAIAAFEQVVEQEQGYAQVWFDLAMAKAASGDLLAAIPHLDRALALKPEQALFLLKRGNVYELLNNKDKACADWQKAAQLGSHEATEFMEQVCK